MLHISVQVSENKKTERLSSHSRSHTHRLQDRSRCPSQTVDGRDNHGRGIQQNHGTLEQGGGTGEDNMTGRAEQHAGLVAKEKMFKADRKRHYLGEGRKVLWTIERRKALNEKVGRIMARSEMEGRTT